MLKKIIYILLLFSFVSSCADNFNAFKRGITGEKSDTADEFLVKKKDPLILPPDFENLPMPDEQSIEDDENLIFTETLESDTETESLSSGSVESSILKKIQSK